MKTKFSILVSLAMILLSSLFSCSDDTSYVPETENETTSKLQDFLDSEYGKETLKESGLTVNNLDLSKVIIEVNESKGAVAFSIPTIKNGIVTGCLNAIVVCGSDEPYRAIYEKWENREDGHRVTLTSGKGLYVATIDVSNNGHQHITEIASGGSINTRARQKGESWWACTTRVYVEAKKACDKDNTCTFLRDVADALSGGQATVSMATAAAIACA